MRSSNWSSASVTNCCAERPSTAQASRSLRWRSGSRRSVNAALPLLPGAARVRGARRRAGLDHRNRTLQRCGAARRLGDVDFRSVAARKSRRSRRLRRLRTRRSRSAARRSRPAGGGPVSEPANRSASDPSGEPADARRRRRRTRHALDRAALRPAWAVRSPCRSSRGPRDRWPPWPKPCGRMAGRAAPLRASRPEEREAKGLASVATCTPPH